MEYLDTGILAALFGILGWFLSRKIDSIDEAQKDHNKRIQKNFTDIAVNTAHDKAVNAVVAEIKDQYKTIIDRLTNIEKDIAALNAQNK